MSLPASTNLRYTGFRHSTKLAQMLYRLRQLADEMGSEGFEEEADTVNTATRDLEWVYESVIDKELIAQWPPVPSRSLQIATH